MCWGCRFEQGYHPEFLGEYAAQQEARNRLVGLSGLALLGIFLILYSDFGSFKVAGLVFAGLPIALTGGVVATLLSGGALSLGSLVGFVTVLGIAARNGIMLISHYRHLQEVEGESFGTALVLRGAEERLAPILMTALTTMLALLPIAVGGERPGQEIEHPMALVIIGGSSPRLCSTCSCCPRCMPDSVDGKRRRRPRDSEERAGKSWSLCRAW